MQIQHKLMQHSTAAFSSRLYAHAPLSERGRYVTGSRHLCGLNDGRDCSTFDGGGCEGESELGAKRRRTSSSAAADLIIRRDESYSRGELHRRLTVLTAALV